MTFLALELCKPLSRFCLTYWLPSLLPFLILCASPFHFATSFNKKWFICFCLIKEFTPCALIRLIFLWGVGFSWHIFVNFSIVHHHSYLLMWMCLAMGCPLDAVVVFPYFERQGSHYLDSLQRNLELLQTHELCNHKERQPLCLPGIVYFCCFVQFYWFANQEYFRAISAFKTPLRCF